MNQFYTYGQKKNVLMRLTQSEIKLHDQSTFAGLFIEVVPPAVDQKNLEVWKRLHYYNLCLFAMHDPELKEHTMSVGEQIVYADRMPRDIGQIEQTDFEPLIKPDALNLLILSKATGSSYDSLPLIVALTDATGFPDLVKRCAAHEAFQHNAVGKMWLKKIQSTTRNLDGVPQKWLEDYITLLDEAGALPEESAVIRTFIDNYVEPEEEEHR